MTITSIQNLYEKLVFDEINRLNTELGAEIDPDLEEDIACIALNKLPAYYIRHIVDAMFFLTTEDRAEIESRVSEAVKAAFAIVQKSPDRD
jgi:hypothetical protein